MDPTRHARQWMGEKDQVKVSALFHLLGRGRRFSELARLTGIQFDNQLTQALKVLLETGLVNRLVIGKGPQGIQYEITPEGIATWNEWYFLDRLSARHAAEGLIEKPKTTLTDAPTTSGKLAKAGATITITPEEAMRQ